MSITTRSSVLAVKVEPSEGVLTQPGAADYLAMQDDMEMSAEFENLENAELKNSLGKAKPITGSESPSASFSHYLRHSGVEGQAPNFGEILKAGFGAEVVASTEYDTVAASTVSVIKVDAGEGVNFERGQSVLVKDSANGYSIRPVESVSGDDLTLGMNLENAPGVGIALGKCVLYKPADKNHQSLSIFNYIGNSGAVQAMAGARVTEIGASFEAGGLINAAFSFEGIEYFMNPMTTSATDSYIDWTDDQGTAAASVAVKSYKDPHELADAIAIAMNGQTSETVTCEYSDLTGAYTFTCTGAVFSMLWNTGANAANTIAELLNFSAAGDDTGALTYSGSPVDFSAPHSPAFDDSDPNVAKNNELYLGDADSIACVQASNVEFTVSTPKRDIESVCAVSGKSGSIINEREVTVSVTALLDQYDVDKFRRFRENANTKMLYNFGKKVGGNWVSGAAGSIYMPSAVISSFSISDDDGLATLEIELSAYVDNAGNGEVYLTFV